MESITEKKILIISPQSWGGMLVSKHHYAMELARAGNTVYFLNPPSRKFAAPFSIDPVQEISGLYQVSYRPYFRIGIRVISKPLFYLLMDRQAKWLLKQFGFEFDIVWSFDNLLLFNDLRPFKGKTTIYHPVDPVEPRDWRVARTVDLILSVSKVTIDQLSSFGVPAYFLSHGLGGPFANAAREIEANPKAIENPTQKKIGYIGNLLFTVIDHENLMATIREHPEMEFHFWGSYKLDMSNLGGIEDNAFISYLENAPNVILHGVQPKEVLVNGLRKMDAFFMVYHVDLKTDKAMTSHKILEYLSLGKVFISSHIAAMHETGLIEMLDDPDNSKYLDLFNKVTSNLEIYNAVELQQKRINYALENTYENHLKTIACHLKTLRPAP